jgi:hypothetical protein
MVQIQPEQPNAGLQLQRVNSIQPNETNLLEKHAVVPSAAKLCYAARGGSQDLPFRDDFVFTIANSGTPSGGSESSTERHPT